MAAGLGVESVIGMRNCNEDGFLFSFFSLCNTVHNGVPWYASNENRSKKIGNKNKKIGKGLLEL